MRPSPGVRLDDLFVRYWDRTLTPEEADELARLLAADQRAREQFRLLCMQAVASAELPAFAPPVPERRAEPAAAPTATPTATARGWSRRRVLGLIGGGVAAGVGGVLVGRWLGDGRGERGEPRVAVVAAQGAVTLRDSGGNLLPQFGAVPNGATLSTQGFGSSAVLRYRDGSTIRLLGDSTVSVHDDGQQVRLHQGTASADIRPQPVREERLTLATHLVGLPGLSGVLVTLGQGALAAEVEVHRGTVSAARPTGEPMEVVATGELLTVRGGDYQKRRTPPTPDSFTWDMRRPASEGLRVGRRDETAEGPVLRPESWPDPYYYGTRMYQIRSDEPWTRGFFRMHRGSTVHVRYRVRTSGPGQVCFCVRKAQMPSSATGMLEHDGRFEAGAPGEWQWWRVKAEDMLANKHAPAFDAPWVGFLIIFNTYEADLGLEVAEFRVTPPDPAADSQ